MARPLRIEYNGALCHVLSRGNAGEHIFKDPKDRLTFLDIMGNASEHFSLDVCRDLLIYLLWETGLFTNYQIGNNFGLAYSTVSQIVGHVRQRLSENTELQRRVEEVKTISKV